eukprot:g5370.t1
MKHWSSGFEERAQKYAEIGSIVEARSAAGFAERFGDDDVQWRMRQLRSRLDQNVNAVISSDACVNPEEWRSVLDKTEVLLQLGRFREAQTCARSVFLAFDGLDWTRLDTLSNTVSVLMTLLLTRRYDEAVELCDEAMQHVHEWPREMDVTWGIRIQAAHAVALNANGYEDFARNVFPVDDLFSILQRGKDDAILMAHYVVAEFMPYPRSLARSPAKPVGLLTTFESPSDRNVASGWMAAADFDSSYLRDFFLLLGNEKHVERTRFPEKYMDLGKPVIITGAMQDWPAYETWKREEFLSKYGDAFVSVARSKDIVPLQMFANEGLSDQIMRKREKLRHFANYAANFTGRPGDVPYSFARLQNPKQILKDISFNLDSERWSWLPEDIEKELIFYLGPKGSNIYLHEHAAAVNFLVFGRKAWVLLPPSIYKGRTIRSLEEWMRTDRADVAQPLIAVQNEGEALFVPQGWTHATINLQTSIGLAMQLGFDLASLENI